MPLIIGLVILLVIGILYAFKLLNLNVLALLSAIWIAVFCFTASASTLTEKASATDKQKIHIVKFDDNKLIYLKRAHINGEAAFSWYEKEKGVFYPKHSFENAENKLRIIFTEKKHYLIKKTLSDEVTVWTFHVPKDTVKKSQWFE